MRTPVRAPKSVPTARSGPPRRAKAAGWMPRGAGPLAAAAAPPAADALGSSSLLSMNVSPFLWKTFSLVSDPATDAIVSWSPDGMTFTVWKPDVMEREILPKIFKHSNFASFVRQLNNYGFRKCHTDRYEFGVPGFQRGAPELLKTLKRHDAQRQSKKPSSGAKADLDEGLGSPAGAGAARQRRGGPPGALTPATAALVEVGVYGGMHSEVEQLKRDRMLLLKEVMRLRETSAHTAEEVRSLSTRLANTEAMQTQMLTFLQQHISPTLLNANSHILQGRKRRHLLLGPASPGRDDAQLADLAAMSAQLPIPGAGGAAGGAGFDDVAMFGAGPAGASPPGSGVLLRELPDESVPYGLRPRGVGGVGGRAPSAALDMDMPSYNALMPPPPLPDVMPLPQLSQDADIFSWSDLLADLPPTETAAASPSLSRLNSEDIHKIVRDMQLDGPASLGHAAA